MTHMAPSLMSFSHSARSSSHFLKNLALWGPISLCTSSCSSVSRALSNGMKLPEKKKKKKEGRKGGEGGRRGD